MTGVLLLCLYYKSNEEINGQSLFSSKRGNQFGRAVQQGLTREWRVFRRWEDLWLAINRACGGKGDAPDSSGPHRLHHVGGRDHILLQVFSRVMCAKTDISISRQMENTVTLTHSSR